MIFVTRALHWLLDKISFSGGDKSGWTNSDVRRYWVIRKYKLRIYAGLYVVCLLAVGGELSTPNFSFSTSLVKEVAPHSPTLQLILLEDSRFYKNYTNRLSASKNGEEKARLHAVKETLEGRAGERVKICFIILVYLIFVLHLFSDAPLSDRQLLRLLAVSRSGKTFYHKLLNELEYYAKSVPTQKLPLRCSSCQNRQCSNRMKEGDTKAIMFWNKIFAELPSSEVDRNLTLLYQCRIVFYLRYGLLVTILALIPIFFIAQTGIWYFQIATDVNFRLLLFLIILSIIFVIFGYIFGAYGKRPGGFWAKYSESVDHLLNSPRFLKLFDEKICNPFSYSEDSSTVYSRTLLGQEARALKTLLDYLDRILIQKVHTKILSGKLESSGDVVISICMLLEHIRKFFISIYGGKNEEFLVLFLEPANEFLKPLVVSVNDHLSVEESNEELFFAHFAMENQNPSCKAWKNLHVEFSNESIDSYISAKGLDFSSQMAYPITIEEKTRDLLSTRGVLCPKGLGVISVFSKYTDTFKMENMHINQSIVAPFSYRIGTELVGNLFRTSGQGGPRI